MEARTPQLELRRERGRCNCSDSRRMLTCECAASDRRDDTDGLRTLIDRHETYGVLDLHLAPHRPELGAAAVTSGRIELFAMYRKTRITLLRTLECFSPNIIVTSLAWSPEHHSPLLDGSLAVSLSNGHIATVKLDKRGEVTGDILAHTHEAWTVAWSQGKWTKPMNPHRIPFADLEKHSRHVIGNGHFLYSGGDDNKIKAYDMVCDGLPEYGEDTEGSESPAGLSLSDPASPSPGTNGQVPVQVAEVAERDSRILSTHLGEALEVISEDDEEKRKDVSLRIGSSDGVQADTTAAETLDGTSGHPGPEPNNPHFLGVAVNGARDDGACSIGAPPTSAREIRERHLRSITSSEQPRSVSGEPPLADANDQAKFGEAIPTLASRLSPAATSNPHSGEETPAIANVDETATLCDLRHMRSREHGPKEPDGWVRWDAKTHTAGVTALLPLPLPEMESEFILTGSYDEYVRVVVPNTTKRWKCRAEVRLGAGIWRLKLLRKRMRGSHHTFLVLASCTTAGAAVLDAVCDRKGRWRIDVVGRLDKQPGLCYGGDAVLRAIAGEDEKSEGCCLTIVTVSFYEKKVHSWQCVVGTEESLQKWRSKEQPGG